MQIRRAKESDAPGIWKVHLASVRDLASGDYPDEIVEAWAQPRPLEQLQASIAANPFYVAEKDREIIGYAELEIHLKRVRSVYVAPSHSRQGVASALLAALEIEARKYGLDELRLESSLNAVPFYEANGFEQVQRGRFQLGNNLEMTSIHMRKIIR